MDPIVHFEIPVDNMQRATEFYNIFGWKIQKYPLPDMEYYGVSTVESDQNGMPQKMGCINGGMMIRSHSGVKSPIVVIKVPSIEEALKKVEAAGGRIVMPTRNIGGMGLYARIEDPEGNVIGLWQDLEKKEV